MQWWKSLHQDSFKITLLLNDFQSFVPSRVLHLSWSLSFFIWSRFARDVYSISIQASYSFIFNETFLTFLIPSSALLHDIATLAVCTSLQPSALLNRAFNRNYMQRDWRNIIHGRVHTGKGINHYVSLSRCPVIAFRVRLLIEHFLEEVLINIPSIVCW